MQKQLQKPFYKTVWFWILITVIFFWIIIQVTSAADKVTKSLEKRQLAENVEKLIGEQVKVPETAYKPQAQVEAEFEVVGLEAKFVAVNFDLDAYYSDRYLRTGECRRLEDGCGATFYNWRDVGDKSGFYAKPGSTIVVGYSDHDFDGRSEDTKAEQGEAFKAKPGVATPTPTPNS